MDCNPLSQFSQQLLAFFTQSVDEAEKESASALALAGDAVAPVRLRKCGDIIRSHNEDLAANGDLSLAATARYWQSFAKRQGLQLRLDAVVLMPDEEQREELIRQSKEWRFPLCGITMLHKDRYGLHFQRSPVIAHVLKAVLVHGADYGRLQKTEHSPTMCLRWQTDAGATDGSQELRHYRQQELYKIVFRLVDYSPWRLVEAKDRKEDTLCVNVEAQKCCHVQPKDHVCLVSGPVVEPVKKTATALMVDDYLELRSTHMHLMAMHRNGYRPAGMCNLDTLMKRLGAAAVIVDLFEVRHASAACVVRNGMGSSKGASYILYNSARLETLLRTFAAQVNAGVYEPLPPLGEIDLSVLADDMDWQLIYGYLLTFPELLESLMDQVQQGQCGVHLLVHFMGNLASAFSRYYRHKKVLVQKRDQLMPTLYARVYLIMAVRQVLNVALSLLGIEPVDYV
ncbi:DALR anticodon-binding domain-containing protein 3 [Drosophila elegans]|uniref:DALR anticodon-binding domain-containing protein 3 n=1 Tax=Drosophila elegans TaxID=30023 RepID=UPI0007E8A360|nr:DALR anticodon-binding domain-containing protein 3 [Drosophila elegans]